MSDFPSKSQIAVLLRDVKLAQIKAAKLGLVMSASLIAMALIDIQDEQTRRDEIVHVNDDPGSV